jgi:hypothetical protein
MNNQAADVALGSGGWEERLESEQERRRLTDLARALPGWTELGFQNGPTYRVQTDNAGQIVPRAGGGAATLRAHPTYLLVSANDRSAHIHVDDLRFWLVAHFDFTEPRRTTREGKTSLRLLPSLPRKTEQNVVLRGAGLVIEGAFTVGDWKVCSSSGLILHIPRQHASFAVEALAFKKEKSGQIRARYPKKGASEAARAATEA